MTNYPWLVSQLLLINNPVITDKVKVYLLLSNLDSNDFI